MWFIKNNHVVTALTFGTAHALERSDEEDHTLHLVRHHVCHRCLNETRQDAVHTHIEPVQSQNVHSSQSTDMSSVIWNWMMPRVLELALEWHAEFKKNTKKQGMQINTRCHCIHSTKGTMTNEERHDAVHEHIHWSCQMKTCLRTGDEVKDSLGKFFGCGLGQSYHTWLGCCIAGLP